MSPRRRSPGDGTLFKRARDGLWIGRVEVPSTDGKRRQREVSSKNRNEAIAKLKRLKADVAAGRVATTPNTTVEKWLTHWVETIVKPNRRPMTYRSYEQVIRLHILPSIGSVRLDRLSAEDIRGMYRTTQDKSPRFALLAHQVLSRALKQAAAEGMLARNPMQAVEAPKYTPEERQAFSFQVATHLISTAFSSCDEMTGTRWAAAFLLGERRGELLGLEWDRVNLEEGFVNLAWQLQRMKKGWTPPAGQEARQCSGTLWWTRPKSQAGMRTIPIYKLPPLWEALKRLKELDSPRTPLGLVFHKGGKPISPEQHHKDWKHLLELAKVPDAPLHAIRHTTTTLLRKADVPADVRMMITGHSSVQAHEVYVHLEHEDAAKALGSLTALMPPLKR